MDGGANQNNCHSGQLKLGMGFRLSLKQYILHCGEPRGSRCGVSSFVTIEISVFKHHPTLVRKQGFAARALLTITHQGSSRLSKLINTASSRDVVAQGQGDEDVKL